jgi:hypothetical protein
MPVFRACLKSGLPENHHDLHTVRGPPERSQPWFAAFGLLASEREERLRGGAPFPFALRLVSSPFGVRLAASAQRIELAALPPPECRCGLPLSAGAAANPPVYGSRWQQVKTQLPLVAVRHPQLLCSFAHTVVMRTPRAAAPVLTPDGRRGISESARLGSTRTPAAMARDTARRCASRPPPARQRTCDTAPGRCPAAAIPAPLRSTDRRWVIQENSRSFKTTFMYLHCDHKYFRCHLETF